MKSYKNIVSAYHQKVSVKQAEEERLRNAIEKKTLQIERLKKKEAKLGYVSWINEIIKPLAEELRKKLNKKHVDILGPFGINCQTSIWFYNTEKERAACKVKSITLRPYDLEEGILYVETRKTKNSYEKNTIGEVNGGNIVCDEVPKNASINWFLKYVH